MPEPRDQRTRAPSVELRRGEALAQPLRDRGVERSEFSSRAVSEREQAAAVDHPFLEAERQGLAEVGDVGGDASRERLELSFHSGQRNSSLLVPSPTEARRSRSPG